MRPSRCDIKCLSNPTGASPRTFIVIAGAAESQVLDIFTIPVTFTVPIVFIPTVFIVVVIVPLLVESLPKPADVSLERRTISLGDLRFRGRHHRILRGLDQPRVKANHLRVDGWRIEEAHRADARDPSLR